jgi:hypothetical protein
MGKQMPRRVLIKISDVRSPEEKLVYSRRFQSNNI